MKNYVKPTIIDIKIIVEDIVATSGEIGGINNYDADVYSFLDLSKSQ